MPHCPNCNSKLPTTKLLFLTRKTNWVRCAECKEYLFTKLPTGAANLGYAGASILTLNTAYRQFRQGDDFWYWPLPILFLVLTVGTFLQLKTMKFKVGEKPDLINEEWPEEDRKDNLIRFLVGQYHDKTDEELSIMMEDNDLAEEARLAAEQLLKKRNTTHNKS